jgi:hypothetical protein
MSAARILNGQHASASAEWWTPSEIVDPARALWPFDLDPASCEYANRQIKASWIMTAEHDGLAHPWPAETVWCNPPSKRGEESAWEWWCKAATEWSEGRARRALFQVFNPSSFFAIAQTKAHQRGLPTPQHAARVEFRERVRYLQPAASLGLPGIEGSHAVRGNAPPHGSALLLLTDRLDEVLAFADAYAHLGAALTPVRVPRRAEAADRRRGLV